MSWERKVQKKPTWGSSTQASQESLFKTRGFSKPVEQPLEETALKPIQFRGTDTSHLDHLKVNNTNRPIVTPRIDLSNLQAKLTVGAPGDKYEQEADAMANQVMSMPDAAVQRETVGEEQSEEVRAKPLASAITPLLQREAMPEEELQTKPLAASISSLVQRETLPEEDEQLHPKALAQPLDQRIAPIQQEAMPEEDEVHPKLSEEIAQREAMPDEEDKLLQGKAIASSDIQREEMSEDDEMRMKPVGNGTLQRSPDGNLQAGEGIESRLNQSKGGGSPLSDEVRSFMEPRFGADFSQVRVHTGSEAVQMNRDLNAQAFTHKRDVYFGAGKSPANSELTAHELTHVMQQTGDTNGSVQRFKVEGPFDFGDPVHETITQESLRKAGVIGKTTTFKDKRMREYNRGVIWNDDPEGLLFDDNKERTDDFSSGLLFALKFHSIKSKAEKGKFFGPKDELLGRSHFGDLQFLHSMASKDGEDPKFTQSNIMMWAEFTYKVAIGEIPATTKMEDVNVSGFRELFPKQKDMSVSQFFGIKNIGNVKERATGSLLHTVQDSYASGHAEREDLGAGRKGKILSFHSYTNQDKDKHAEGDVFQGKGSNEEKLKNTPGALDAVDKGAEILKLIQAKKVWEEVKLYLLTEVFTLSDNPTKSGPGDKFRKKGTQPAPPQPVPSRPVPPQSAPPQSAPPQSAPPQSAPPQSAPPQSAPPQSNSQFQSKRFAGQSTLETCGRGEYRMLVGEKDTEAVKKIQETLGEAGISIKVDGVYGEETRRAVAKFKREHSPQITPSDGVVGPKTSHALDDIAVGRGQ